MKIIKMIKNKLFCKNGKHEWHYYTSGNRYLTIDDKTGFWDVPVRECENCDKFEEKRTSEYLEYN